MKRFILCMFVLSATIAMASEPTGQSTSQTTTYDAVTHKLVTSTNVGVSLYVEVVKEVRMMGMLVIRKRDFVRQVTIESDRTFEINNVPDGGKIVLYQPRSDDSIK